jgi:hypothetical protein
MVDNTNPTSQFHPYQPQTATPQVDKLEQASTTGLGGLINKLGLGNGNGSFDVNGAVGRARNVARANPSMVLGGLAALAIGAGLLRGRRTR